MKKFAKRIDLRDRREMIDFLRNHYRYFTANNWNRSTSYAQNLKVYNLGLTSKQENNLLELMDCDGSYDEVNALIDAFNERYDYQFQAGFSGRSGGYLVLYQGGWEPSEYKSFCTVCGQRNYTSVKETGCRCGRCGNEARVDYEVPPKETYTYIGTGLDMNESYEDWDLEKLKDRAELVSAFDALCDDIVETAVWLADNAKVEEKEVLVPKTVRVVSYPY